MNRRQFCGTFVVLGAHARHLFGAGPSMDETLRAALERRKIPAVVAAAATANDITYAGAFGKRDADSGLNVTSDSIFAIASMTKAVTSAAAMQFVERGKVKLDEPASRYLPALSKLEVLDGFDKATGKPILRPATKPVTLKHLLTHTSGFAYPTWDSNMLKYTQQTAAIPGGTVPSAPTPLMFEPGTRWQYGYSVDWAGRLVESLSGMALEQYFQKNIFQPLGMKDTSYILPSEKFDRLVSLYQRQTDGGLKQNARVLPAQPQAFNGGGGLYSTTGDYVRFMQMILRGGRGPGKDQILQPKTVELMSSNHIGDLRAGVLKTAQPERSSDLDLHPGATDKWGLGFLINTTPYTGGRSAGSLAWAGINNTYYWIDPKRGLCAVVMMQFLPFADAEAVGLLREFESAVYKA
jgi:CubicO group peptidase (beta-lactamase class C family)